MIDLYFSNQALKDWGLVLAPGFSPPAELFLIASLIPLATLEMTGKKRAYVDVKDLASVIKPKALLTEGISRLVKAGYAEEDGNKLVLGAIAGINKIEYLFMENASAPQQGMQVSAAPRVPAEQEAPTPVLINQSSLELMKARLTELFSAYKEEMEQVYRMTELPDQIFRVIKTSIEVAVQGKDYKPIQFMQYLSALTTIKAKSKVYLTKFSGKEMKQASDIVSAIPTHALLEMVPYFVLDYCTEVDTWHMPTAQNFLGAKQTLLSIYNKKHSQNGNNSRQRGTFS